MKNFFESLLKSILKMFILILLTFIICSGISHFKSYNLNKTLMFAGLAYMLIGLLSNLGSSAFMGNAKYLQARSSGHRTSFENTKDDFRLRDSSLKFMTFMAISGFILCMLSYTIN
ncbi:hypothetical protein [Clostridium sp. ZS2-4]|uniref:hypothetical protein n=1 Tax=Clostridium sp. ZS2-4 TaxID=2987703 RepID=UPI00227BF3D9|nr:hypothetical protein [Clostridium sp. ZS2-4]MCY6356287.1 hypothetical protein [Clostridium sp. ZS2-4]